MGPADFVLFCVKLWDVESAGEKIRPMVGPGTAVITLQNGIDADERLVPILGSAAVMPGVANISATIAEPGVIRQTGTVMRMVFGEPDGSRSSCAVAFAEMCKNAGIELPWLGGKVVELGRQHNVPTPAHALMYAALKPYIMGTPA